MFRRTKPPRADIMACSSRYFCDYCQSPWDIMRMIRSSANRTRMCAEKCSRSNTFIQIAGQQKTLKNRSLCLLSQKGYLKATLRSTNRFWHFLSRGRFEEASRSGRKALGGKEAPTKLQVDLLGGIQSSFCGNEKAIASAPGHFQSPKRPRISYTALLRK